MSPTTDDRGAVAVLVAIFAAVMFGLAAIVVDLGMVRVTVADAQSAADAAALAGAAALYDAPTPSPNFSAAVAEVKSSAAANGVSASSWASECTAPAKVGWNQEGSGTDCILFDSGTAPRRVQVVTPSRQVAAAFGGLLGYAGSSVSASAQAQARARRIPDCSLCLRGDLDVQGRGSVTVRGDGSLIAGEGDAQAPDAQVDVAGDGALAFVDFPPSPSAPSSVWSPDPVEVASTTDPFSGSTVTGTALPVQDDDTICADGPIDTAVAHRQITVTGICTVTDGTLVVTGQLLVEATGFLTTSGSTVFLGCRRNGVGDVVVSCATSNDSPGGWLSIKEGGVLEMSDGKEGVRGRPLSLVHDPANGTTSSVAGVVWVRNGSIYGARATLNVSDSGSVTVSEGLVSMRNLRMRDFGGLAVEATGLASVPGPYRLALVK